MVAAINEQRVSDGLLPVQDVTQWREDIRRRLLYNQDLVADLPEDCQAKLPTIEDLLDKIDVVPNPSPQGLLWGDAAIHNLLVDDDGHIVAFTILRMERLATSYMTNCMSQQSLPETLKKFMVAITIRRSFGLGMRRQVECG